MDKGKISALQFAMLMYMYTVGTAALIQPHTVVFFAKQDAWVSIIIIGIIQLGLITLYLNLGYRYPHETIIEYSRSIMGTWIGTAIGVMYILFFLILGAYVTRNIGDFIGSVVLPQTPINVGMLVILIPVIYGCFLGIEVLGRTAEILFPFSMVIFVLATILLIPKMDPSELFPIFAEGVQPVIKASYPLFGFPSLEIVICLMLIPFVKNQKKVKKYFYITSVGTLITELLITLFTIMVLGVDMTARSPYAVYDMAREIHIERILERAEVVVGIIWLITSFMKLSLCFYAATIATVQCFKMANYKYLIIPYFFLLLPLSIWVIQNSAELEWSGNVYPMVAVFPGLVIPVLLMIVDHIRRNHKSTNEGTRKKNTEEAAVSDHWAKDNMEPPV